jgi:transcriptional regulator with XRE-family HTH domain
MTTPHGPTSGRLRLRTALRTAREAALLTQQQVADAMDWSLSKVIRIEKGTVSISTNDVRALLHLYQVTDERHAADLVDLARAARKKAWWTAYRTEVPPHFGELMGLEAEASVHIYFQPTAVPGLLQTEAYARALLSNIAPGRLTPEQIETRVEIRMARQRAVLEKPNPPRLEAVLDEAVLRRIADSPETMREQLLHLIKKGAAENIVIQVLPFTAGVNTIETSFIILQFPDPDDGDVVYIENSPVTGHVFDRPDDISPYLRAYERLQETSLSKEESLSMIAKVAGELG